MRISRKIGLSYFVTFLLVIALGMLSIYSLRSIYKGLSQVFLKDLPATRAAYQVSISLEDILSQLNNYLITQNENFKITYETSNKNMQDSLNRLKKFTVEEGEKADFEMIVGLAGEINLSIEEVFNSSETGQKLFKDIKALEAKFKNNLDKLIYFEENKILNEKDVLLVQAQCLPASALIMQIKLDFLELLSRVNHYMVIMSGEGSGFDSKIESIEKNISDYKNFYGYSISERERSAANTLTGLISEIRDKIDSIAEVKEGISKNVETVFMKEKSFIDTLDKIIAFKKSGISSKLGIGAALTEDIPSIQNISKIEKDLAESLRISGKYILTDDTHYKNAYYGLRQDVDKGIKDYERHTRLRGTEKYLEDISAKDKDVMENINRNLEAYEKKKSALEEIEGLKSAAYKKLNELLAYNDKLIKGTQDNQKLSNNLAPAMWALLKLKGNISDSFKMVSSYLVESDKSVKDVYSSLYFDMKKNINSYINTIDSENEMQSARDIEGALDKLNTAVLGVFDHQDAIIQDRGWSLVKLEEGLRDSLNKAMENEILLLDNSKKSLSNKIAVINILVLVLIGLVAGIAMFIIFYTTKSITNPIKELYKGAEVIGKGNLDQRLNIKTGDEIEELAEGFNKMASELKGLYTNLENKVKERTLQLAEANDALARTNKELDEFTYIVSHDLKEPLRGVKAFTKLLLEEYSAKLDKEAGEYLKTISDSSSRMTRLIEDLLNLSRIGRIKNIEQNIDFNDILSDVRKNLAYSLEEKKAELVVKEGFPKMTCDRIRITEVFTNLISNAIKYTKKDAVPIIEVGYMDEKGSYEFYVKDNGIGIEEQYYDKIFQIFQRLHGKGEYEGTGAGLTIVKKIVENHGGKIWVASEPGVGSTFYFTLPKSG